MVLQLEVKHLTFQDTSPNIIIWGGARSSLVRYIYYTIIPLHILPVGESLS